MSAVLSFLLECAAIAALIGFATSLASSALLLLACPLSAQWRASRRADLAFLLATMPALMSVCGVVAAALPSIASALGLGWDHCDSHPHHAHLCIVHSAGWRPLLATFGALATAAFVFRSALLARRTCTMRRRIGVLERLGVRVEGRFPIITVHGPPVLCHALGISRRRIVISSDLLRAMSPGERRAALAHEEAHLRRRDPAALLALSVCGLFGVATLAKFCNRQFHAAAEEACDAEAAYSVRDATLVAAALVRVMDLQRSGYLMASELPAFGETALARRVRILLERPLVVSARSRGISLAAAAGCVGLIIAILQAGELHHAIETLLHHLS